jgi:CRISPR-associated protein Csb1
MTDLLRQADDWLQDDSAVVALVMHQWLEPVDGKNAVIFPPTYAKPQGSRQDDWLGYNIDRLEDGSTVCQIDSVGSQANRMEPIFKREKYKHLVPQVVITAGEDRQVHLLDAGHRAADAIVRFSTLGPELYEAFLAFHRKGNAEKLARIAPTSIVFGSWDSRATQAKLPRVVRSVIRAFKGQPIHRSAQYSTIAGEILEGPDVEITTEGPKAELGLAHVPAVWTHGGIHLTNGSEIVRDACLNLVVLRSLGSESSTPEGNNILRRYILGLALVAFSAPPETNLREGCQLILSADRHANWQLVKYDGSRSDFPITPELALEFANAAADEFKVQQPAQPATFNAQLAQQVRALDEKQRKELLRGGPVTPERIQSIIAAGTEPAGGPRRRRQARGRGQEPEPGEGEQQ